ncbi:hypothetical protein [Catellatospora sichuanensis]|uniref:hypothetical protein n=1 Tax=Catellatospora sichuanensis TaxID=1969805 RepID=UPI001C905D3E|nr:hypothetical protein [Catellatospora sichuanensis]
MLQIQAAPSQAATSRAILWLGLRTTAEGVETAEQLVALAGLGVPFAQGFHLGVPQPLSAVRQ